MSNERPMSVLGPTGERQEHVDAVVAFACDGQRTRMFRVLDVLTVKWATGDLPEECRFPSQHAVGVLEEGKKAHNKYVRR